MTKSFADSDTRFTDWLRQSAEPYWTAATTHRFTTELVDDVLDEAVFRRYLIQDYAFIGTLASLVGFAVGNAPSMDQKARLTAFLSVLTGGENDYFMRSFEALGMPETEWRQARGDETTRALAELFAEATAENGYDEIMAVLLPVEWVYLSWATAAGDKRPARFFYAEWIALHNDPEFASFVNWMRDELDRRGPELPAKRQSRLAELFRRAAALEIQFFEGPYGGG